MPHKCLSATICVRLSLNTGWWIKACNMPARDAIRQGYFDIDCDNDDDRAISKSSANEIKNTALHISLKSWFTLGVYTVVV